MSRSCLVPLVAALAFAACGERDAVTLSPPGDAVATNAPANARERLAARLAVALADPALREELSHRFAESPVPEGKLQFQALARADGNRLLARLAASGGTSVAEMVADLDAARQLELYLPVAAQRAAWQGSAQFLVATLENDGERPVAFDAGGRRTLLSADHPPDIPVIALVPQETDFTRPSFAMCAGGDCADGGAGGGGSGSTAPGLYLVGSDLLDDGEGWLKGNPEIEVHLYGEAGDSTVQLGCTSEHSWGPYYWNADGTSWRGSAALLTQADLAAYLKQNSKGVVRIVVWEDDDEPCVTHTNASVLADIVRFVDQAYKSLTGSKADPTLIKGVRAANAAFGLAQATRNIIKTSDDFLGHAVEFSAADWRPGTANFTLRGEGAMLTGALETRWQP